MAMTLSFQVAMACERDSARRSEWPVEIWRERVVVFAGTGCGRPRCRGVAAVLFEGGVHGGSVSAPNGVGDALEDVDNEQGVVAVEGGEMGLCVWWWPSARAHAATS